MIPLSGTGRIIAILLAVLLIVVLIFGVFIGLQFQVVQVNTTTESNTNTGRSHIGAGGGFDGEMLDQTQYISSWSNDLNGQKVTAQGRSTEGIGFSCLPDATRYRVFINKGLTWDQVADIPAFVPFGGVGLGQVVQYQIHGILPHGSGLRVLYEFHCAFGDWIWLVRDEARVLSGIGTVDWLEQQYTVGDTATVRWEIPYITDEASGLGWSLFILSTASGNVIGPIRLLTEFGSYDYAVSSGDFAVTSGCRNELVATLRNELWGKDFDTTTIIDVSGLGPTVTDLSFRPLRPQIGDQITLSWDAAPNPESGLPLTKIIVKYGFGGIDNENELSADARTTAISVGQAGRLHVEIIAYDEGCRPSPPAEVDINVGEETPEFAGLSFLALFAIIAAVIGGIIAARYIPARPVIRFLIFLVPIAFVLGLIAVGVLT